MSSNPKNAKKRKRPQPILHPQTSHYAKILNETEQTPRVLISQMLEFCGVDFIEETIKEALETQEKGGLPVRTGTRQRTLGGVFFYIARNKMPAEIKRRIFLNPSQRLKAQREKMARFQWETRIEAFERLQVLRIGKVREVRINLVGRPGKFEKHNGLVITTMKHEKGFPELPFPLQDLPIEPTTYTVYIAENQWQKVYPLLKDPKELLTVEGICSYDGALPGITVFAHSVKTTKQRKDEKEAARKKWEESVAKEASEAPPAKEAKSPLSAASKKAPKPQKTGKTRPTRAIPPALAEKPALVVDERYDEADQKKFRELHAAAELYRDKIAKLEASDQKFGLDMLRTLLKQTEDALSKIAQKYDPS